MSNRKPEDESVDLRTNQTKRRRIDEEQHPNVKVKEVLSKLASAAVPNEGNKEVRPQIFKLDVDCVQEVFDWLSIADIHSVAGTCTRMQRIAGDYFHPNLQQLLLTYRNGELTKFPDDKCFGFKEYVQRLSIGSEIEDFRFIGLHCKSLKQIYFAPSKLNATKIAYIKSILSEVESISFDYISDIGSDIYENFWQFCPRLKHFCVSDSINGTVGNKWLLQSFPTLEHFELRLGPREFPELGAFFDRNPHLQKLTIPANQFMLNINTMIQAKIKLQILEVVFIGNHIDETFYGHLKQLHDQGFYQRLHLIVEYLEQQQIDIISTLNGLEKLFCYHNAENLNLISFKNLKELGFLSFTSPTDLQSTVKSLVNLERLCFAGIESEKIIEPFIQYSAKLKAIKILYLDGIKSINLSELNKKREKLVGARKVNIYLGEDDFLATKWSNKTTDLKMIELKRSQSCDWQIPNYRY